MTEGARFEDYESAVKIPNTNPKPSGKSLPREWRRGQPGCSASSLETHADVAQVCADGLSKRLLGIWGRSVAL